LEVADRKSSSTDKTKLEVRQQNPKVALTTATHKKTLVTDH